jgi:hypothetical protein
MKTVLQLLIYLYAPYYNLNIKLRLIVCRATGKLYCGISWDMAKISGVYSLCPELKQ